MRLTRAAVVPRLIGDYEDLLFVTGLGAAGKDVAALNGGAANLFPLGGAMGAATCLGLGLALAQPARRVMVVTGDGELLMNVGSLATVAVADPHNLSILCVDNSRYGETGNQLTHTEHGVALADVARGFGVANAMAVERESDIPSGAEMLRRDTGPNFVVLRVSDEPAPAAIRERDGTRLRLRFRDALESVEGME